MLELPACCCLPTALVKPSPENSCAAIDRENVGPSARTPTGDLPLKTPNGRSVLGMPFLTNRMPRHVPSTQRESAQSNTPSHTVPSRTPLVRPRPPALSSVLLLQHKYHLALL